MNGRRAVLTTLESLGRRAADLHVVLNPQIESREGTLLEEEGCLSVPGFTATVLRAAKITVAGLDRTGKRQIIEAQDLLARALQHEIDHLNGILFLTHLSPLKREVIRRKIKKLIQAGEWD